MSLENNNMAGRKDPKPNKRKYRGKRCSALGCPSYEGDPDTKFFNFPSRNLEARNLWIKALKINLEDGSEWKPSKKSVVCQKHFVLGRPSPTRLDPDYAPSIFPTHGQPKKKYNIARSAR